MLPFTMKMLYSCSVVSLLVQVCRSSELYCRDNENKPVEWWYIYKPPPDAAPKLDLGLNFSFITSNTVGRWKPSKRYINSNSMLLHTLSPLYKTKYADHLAVVAYSNKDNGVSKGTSAHGLMMADESGGIWMGHTVPGLLEFTEDRPSFPSSELLNGHLIMCLSLDLPTLNLVAEPIREVAPEVVRMRVPLSVRHSLPDWQYFNRPDTRQKNSLTPLPLDFFTTAKTIRAVLLVRRPGDKRCLYRTFAKAKGIILDVYGHDEQTRSVCEKNYGVRNIDSISLKYPENIIYYIDNKTDRINFAVSTAAHWQKTIGDGPRQYWTCTSSMEREDSTEKGGIVVCVEDYSVWWSFDNMKIREPKC